MADRFQSRPRLRLSLSGDDEEREPLVSPEAASPRRRSLLSSLWRPLAMFFMNVASQLQRLLYLLLLPVLFFRRGLSRVVGVAIMPGQRWVLEGLRRWTEQGKRLPESIKAYLQSMETKALKDAREALEEEPLRGRQVLIPRHPGGGFLEGFLFERGRERKDLSDMKPGPTAIVLSGSGQVLEYESWNVGLLLQHGCRRVITMNYNGVSGSGSTKVTYCEDSLVQEKAATWRPSSRGDVWGIEKVATNGARDQPTSPETMLCDVLCAMRFAAALDEDMALDRCAITCKPERPVDTHSSYQQIMELGRRGQERLRKDCNILLFGHSIGGAVALDAAMHFQEMRKRKPELARVRVNVVADRTFNRLSCLAGYFLADLASYLLFIVVRSVALCARVPWILETRVFCKGIAYIRRCLAVTTGWSLFVVFTLAGWEMTPQNHLSRLNTGVQEHATDDKIEQEVKVLVVSHPLDRMMLPGAKLWPVEEAMDLQMESIAGIREDAHNRPLHTPRERRQLRQFVQDVCV